MDALNLPPKHQKALEGCVDQLTASLRDNLWSAILYGSAVRGDISKKQSDLNLLLVLNNSNPEAHRAIAHAIKAAVPVRPMVVCRAEMEESFRAFAVKFESIKRNYRVLHGEDPFDKVPVDRETLRFLVARSLRNLRLRCIYTYVTLGADRKRYLKYLVHVTPRLFTDLGAALRLNGLEIPPQYAHRLAPFRQVLGDEVDVLGDMLKLKERPEPLSPRDVDIYHHRLFRLLDKAVQWTTP
jgi:predicted nucleotidyltransferase